MSGYYAPPPEENMAGSQTAMTNPEMNSSTTHSSILSEPDEYQASDVDQGSDSDASCNCDDTSDSHGQGEATTSDNSADGGGLDVLRIAPTLLDTSVGDLVSNLTGSEGEPLDPVTHLVSSVCSGSLSSLDPGLGIGELGVTAAHCLDKVVEPAGELTDSVVHLTGSTLQTVGDAVGLSNTTQALACIIDSLGIGNIGTSDGGVVADIVNLPQDILHGANIGDSIGNILSDAGTTVGTELPGLVPSILEDVGSPLISGNLGSDGQESSGSHLVEADVGPQQSNGLILDLLAQPDNGPNHAAEANVGNGQNIVDANLLNGGDALSIPSLGGVGLDSLTGVLDGASPLDISGVTGAAAPLAAVDDVMATLDVGGLLDIGNVQTASNNNGSLLHGLL